ncbi:MAG: hypothetical protein ACI8V2_004281 [Candidatus Latescibacterota bacterium]|jgi:hypothetical protein
MWKASAHFVEILIVTEKDIVFYGHTGFLLVGGRSEDIKSYIYFLFLDAAKKFWNLL